MLRRASKMKRRQALNECLGRRQRSKNVQWNGLRYSTSDKVVGTHKDNCTLQIEDKCETKLPSISDSIHKTRFTPQALHLSDHHCMYKDVKYANLGACHSKGCV
eukprot:m.10319 g.10319  ORF g.10319 m.10319 type:complete len:104 (-) comp5543_c0_seq1:12-323(-)